MGRCLASFIGRPIAQPRRRTGRRRRTRSLLVAVAVDVVVVVVVVVVVAVAVAVWSLGFGVEPNMNLKSSHLPRSGRAALLR